VPVLDRWDSHDFVLDASTVDQVTALAGQLGIPRSAVVRTAWASVLARHLEVAALRVRIAGPGSPRTVLTTHDQNLTFEAAARSASVQESRPPDRRDVTDPTVEFSGQLAVADSRPVDGIALLAADVRDDAADCRLSVNLAAVGPTTAALLAGELRVLLQAAAAVRDTPCAAAPMLPGGNRHQLTKVWGRGPERAPAGCFTALLDRQVSRTPHRVAVRDGEDTVTYTQLRDRGQAMAKALTAAGCGRGDTVGVLLDRGVDFIAALLGTLRAGAAFVPLDTRLPAGYLARLVDRAGCAVVVHDERRPSDAAEVLDLLGGDARPALVDVAAVRVAGSRRGRAVPCCAAEDVAYCLFTSGSTGEPKGAMVEGRGMVNHMLAKLEDLDIGVEDVVGQTGPPSFDIVVWQCLAPLLCGASVAVVPDEAAIDPVRLMEFAERYGLTVLQLVPAVLRSLVHAMAGTTGRPHPAMPSLRWMVPTGDSLPEDLCRQWFEIRPDVPVLNTYGSTECSDDQCHYPLRAWSPDLPTIVPIGRPIPGIAAYVLDEAGEPVPIGVSGELHIGGVGVGRGYLGDAERTAAVFVADPFAEDPAAKLYRTGDKVRWRADGVLEFLGRLDRVVKVRGHRVDVEEIEAALRESEDVYDCVVLPWAHGGDVTDTRLVAYVVPARSRTVDRAVLRRHAERRLPDHLRPAAYVPLDVLPVNSSGKVDRKALKPVDERDMFDFGDEESPETDLEKELAQLWATVLGVTQVPVDRTFIELGGHSLLAMRLVLLVRQRFGVDVGLAGLLEHPSVRRMARFIERAEPAVAPAGTPAVASDPNEAHESFPLTPLQEAYWVGRTDAFELGAVDAHVYLAAECTGLDHKRGVDALRRLVAKHDALRLQVTADGQQRVVPRAEALVQMEDLRGATADTVAERTRAVSDRMAATGPDPRRAPVMEVVVQVLDGDRHLAHVSLGLLVVDGLSEHLLLRDWIALYRGDDTAPSPAVTYRDYVRTVVSPSGTGQHPDWDYWTERSRTLPPGPELPVADRVPARSGAFTRRIARLDRTQWTAFKRRAAEAGVTPTVALLTLFAEVLAHWSGTPWFTVNVLSSWRAPHVPDSDSITGNLSSTLPLEIDCRDRLGFAVQARRVQARLVTDLAHGQVDGVRFARTTARAQGWSPRAVFPVVFAGVLDVDTSFLDELPFGAAVRGSALQTPQVHLDHQVYEYAGALLANWDTVDKAFLPGVVEAAFDAYQRLLATLTAEAAWDEPVAASPLLPRAAVVTPADSALSLDDGGLLHTAFFARAARTPDALAVVDGARRLTYGELAARAAGVSGWLAERGVGPGVLVPILAGKGWAQVVAVLGVLHAGGAYLPVDPALPRRRVDHLLGRSGAGVVLAHSSVGRVVLPTEFARLDVDGAPVSTAAPRPPTGDRYDTAYVIYTSGSTGEPKGVEIDHQGAVNTVADVSRMIDLGPADAILGVSSLSFDLSVYDIFGPLSVGAALVLPDERQARSPAHWADLAVTERITVWNSVPALMELLVDHLAADHLRPPLRAVLLSGDWVPVTLPDRIRELWPAADIIAMGGATEASIWSISYRVGSTAGLGRSIPYGRAMTNQRVYVLDGDGQPRPVLATGEIAIGGVGLARGYWRDPVRTAERFVTHERSGCRLYRTGDLGRVLPDGDIELLGRDDLQVKVNGYRIELGEIEAALSRHEGVRDAAAVVRASTAGGKAIVGYVVPGAGDLDPALLRDHLAETLPRYMVPTSVECLPALPLTPNGKVDRQALAAAASTAPVRAKPRGSTAPDGVERSVLALLAEVLGEADIGADDDFFALGGNSFLAMRLVAAVGKRFGVVLPLSTLFEHATAASLASAIRGGAAPTAGRSPLVAISRAGSGDPFFWVHPVGGTTLCYASLVRHLPSPRPFYGLEAYGLRAGEEPLDTIERMAAAYLREVRTVRPAGPYVLGGWSMGGLVAFEMARRLAAQGERVDRLIVIDAVLPDPESAPAPTPAGGLAARVIADLTGEPAPDGGAVTDPAAVFGVLRARGVLPQETTEGDWRRLWTVYTAHLRAIDRYRPGDYGGTVRLIQAERQPGGGELPVVSWRLAGIDVLADTVPGDHYSMWREGGHLPSLAETVRKHLTGEPVSHV